MIPKNFKCVPYFRTREYFVGSTCANKESWLGRGNKTLLPNVVSSNLLFLFGKPNLLLREKLSPAESSPVIKSYVPRGWRGGRKLFGALSSQFRARQIRSKANFSICLEMQRNLRKRPLESSSFFKRFSTYYALTLIYRLVEQRANFQLERYQRNYRDLETFVG